MHENSRKQPKDLWITLLNINLKKAQHFIPWGAQGYNILTSKYFLCNFYNEILLFKIQWHSFFILGHLLITSKMSTYSSNLNFRLNELEFFLLIGVLT